MKKLIYLAFAFAFFSCEMDSDSNGSNSDVGQGGSLAQFTISGDYLYTVDNQSLNVFNIVNTESPVQVNTAYIGFDIETLFNDKDYLYIGSQTGMFIYSITNPEAPEKLAEVSHFRACDPIIANDTHAFVTLDSSLGCGGDISALQIYDIAKISEPVLVSQRNLIAPKGLALFNNYLFVCDNEVKIFDISNPEASTLVNSINISAFDVIIQDEHLFLIGNTHLYQYQLYSNDITNIKILSTIDI